MDYSTYLEKFRAIQIEHNDFSQTPMTEPQFIEWKKPITETPFPTKKGLLYFQNLYLRLRRLVEKKLTMDLPQDERERLETELKKMNEAYNLTAEKNYLS